MKLVQEKQKEEENLNSKTWQKIDIWFILSWNLFVHSVSNLSYVNNLAKTELSEDQDLDIFLPSSFLSAHSQYYMSFRL